MKDQSNNQPGAQRHAEGEYGQVARKANQERIETSQDETDANDDVNAQSGEGRGHLYEDRQQHDEADKNADKNRLARDRSQGRTP